MEREPDVDRPPVQRWRITASRGPDAPPLSQRETQEAWDAAVAASGLRLPIRSTSRRRPVVIFGAPLQVGMSSEGELMELVLADRAPAWEVREALSVHLPPGWMLVDLEDVWLGGPPLVGRVIGADYRVTLTGPSVSAEALRRAVQALLGAPSLPRERHKGDTLVHYDLRPLLADVQVLTSGPPTTVRIRTRSDPERGTGRADEVVRALADALGSPLTIGQVVRERLVLVDDDPDARALD